MALAAIDKNTPIFKPAFEYQESTLQPPVLFESSAYIFRSQGEPRQSS